VRERLGEMGWSQSELRKRLQERGENVASGLICRWLDGTREPSLTRAALLEEILGVATSLWAVPARVISVPPVAPSEAS
jgi:transcriptional regulator with XRE-family HTH domain